jgi:glycosidase
MIESWSRGKLLLFALRRRGEVAASLRAAGEDGRTRAVDAPAAGSAPPAGGGPSAGFPCEFHVAEKVRRKYGFPGTLFRSNGNAVFADYRAVREFAARMNERRPAGLAPVRAGELNAMGLIDEILHYVFRQYESTVNPGVLERATGALGLRLGRDPVAATLRGFTESFPPAAVFQGTISAAEWFAGSTDARRNAEVSLEELLMLHLANINPAFAPFAELFDDAPLARRSAYADLIAGLRAFLRDERPFGGEGGSIIDFLEAPMRAHPGSLAGQLGFIRDRWGVVLSDEFRRKILSSEDLAREDAKRYPTGGAGAVEAPDYRLLARTRPSEYPETENFTHDTEWMPNVVLLAKNVYVWLHQLSRTHGRTIARLDQVPDGELDRLASWNFTSLWLIGVWHRSPASEKIKRMTGNPEAAPSAYSLHEYEIAPDLGGEEAFGNLSHRAWQRGIRLAADMVPNHTGITSRWMRDHPDFFIQADHPPFPAYRFTGPDLSDDPAYQVRIEDGYWTRSDAAVVFQRIDNGTGRLRYIYHGNDGTNMPWNDTAQLDFLKREVREAVIGQILAVAKKFSVIRFDAAMTLAKKHFHRLWYPHPGTGGDIPSRADHAMQQEEFDRLFPAEFWREVVDRINLEMPNTLLLAEAFWLLEGYFVRTLGMHRVYNSAFMHMLMKEDNALYRGAIRSTLHFNPGILKRYVNFMSNPDEKTAVEQFGKGDKYFGIATLMVTLPGLPMFAHGQVEGFREKYGMEYRRDYHDEEADEELVRRHEREIFPLLKLRRLFSETENFELYDVRDEHGRVIEDIFAYSNMAGGQRAVVCYNNRYETYAGTLKHSAGKLSGGSVRGTTVGEALGIRRGDGILYVFREQRSGLAYVRTGNELHDGGFFVRLRAFESQVFLDFLEVEDADGAWRGLHDELKGAGVSDPARAARAIRLRPLHAALSPLLDPAILDAPRPGVRAGLARVAEAIAQLPPGMRGTPGGPGTPDAKNRIVEVAERAIDSAREFLASPDALPLPLPPPEGGAGDPGPKIDDALVILCTILLEALFGAGTAPGSPLPGGAFDEWLLEDVIAGPGQPVEPGGQGRAHGPDAGETAGLVRCLLTAPGPFPSPGWFETPAVREFVRLNEHDGTVYFHKESMEALLRAAVVLQAFRGGLHLLPAGPERAESGARLASLAGLVVRAAAASGYRFGHFLRYLQSDEFLTLHPGPVAAPPLTQPGH